MELHCSYCRSNKLNITARIQFLFKCISFKTLLRMPMSDAGVSARHAPESEVATPEKPHRRTWTWFIEDDKFTQFLWSCSAGLLSPSQLKIKLRRAVCELITLRLLLYLFYKLAAWGTGTLVHGAFVREMHKTPICCSVSLCTLAWVLIPSCNPNTIKEYPHP